MSARYEIWMSSNTGADRRLIAAVNERDHIFFMRYGRVINGIGDFVLQQPIDLIDWGRCTRNARLEVWRAVDDGPLVLDTETIWLLRRRRKLLTKKRERLIELHAFGLNILLNWHDVVYFAGSSQAEKSGAADDVMKALVRENLGSLATDTARDLSSASFSVAADLGLGATVPLAFSYRKVLPVLQDFSDASARQGVPILFDVVATTPSTFEFRTYKTARGADLSSRVTLSPEFGNLADVDLDEDWRNEATYVYAAGRGLTSNRQVQPASDASRIGAGGPFGRIERVISATNVPMSTAQLTSYAQAGLEASRPCRRFSGTIVDRGEYGKVWRWGDRVKGEFEGQVLTCDIDAVEVEVRGRKQQVRANLYAEEFV